MYTNALMGRPLAALACRQYDDRRQCYRVSARANGVSEAKSARPASKDNPCHYGQARGSVLNVCVGGEWIGPGFAEREFTT